MRSGPGDFPCFSSRITSSISDISITRSVILSSSSYDSLAIVGISSSILKCSSKFSDSKFVY